MPPIVVDTNVAKVAAGLSDMPLSCVEKCIDEILSLIASDNTVALDETNRILDEYLTSLAPWGQSTVGHAFVKWVHDHQATLRCTRVPITPIDGGAEDYEEFPDEPSLQTFDPADRKFVAVARVADASILQASDSKWWGWRAGLTAAGIDVRFVCPAEIAAVHERRNRRGAGSSKKPGKRRGART